MLRRKVRLLLTLTCVLLLTVTFKPAFAQGRLVTDTITSSALTGNLLGDPDTRELLVYLPPSYPQGGRYPVVYLLHAYSQNARSNFVQAGIVNMLDEMMSTGQVQEIIVVMPDATNKYGGSWYANSELTGNYEDYIVRDVVNYIDMHYRTIPDRNARAIMGHSMGGYGAITLAMKHPDVFGVAASTAGTLAFEPLKATIPMMIAENPDGMKGPDPQKPLTSCTYAMGAAFTPNLNNPPFFVDLSFEYPSGKIIEPIWSRFMEHDPVTMLETYADNLASLNGIYFDVGSKDEWGAVPLNELFHQALVTRGIEHTYEVFEGGHDDHLLERLAIAFKFASDRMISEPTPSAVLEANKLIHRRLFEEVWNEGKLYVADEIYSDDYIYHPLFPNPMGDMDKEERKLFIAAYLNAFPDLHFTIEDQIAEGDLVATRWTATGTQKGELMGIPPLGLGPGTTTGIDIARIVDGKIVEVWACFDMLGMLEQIGAVPPTRENYTWGEPSKVTGEPGTPEENKAMAEKTLEFWNQKNLAVIDEIWSPEFIAHHPAIPGSPLDFESFKQVCLAYITALPDLHGVHDETIAEGDKIVCRWTSTGTHLGKLMGIPPTGKKVTYTGITITRFADGKIVEQWWTMDTLGLMQQLGAIPPMQKDYSNVFFMTLSPGLNMISLPLEPQTPYTARSLAEKLSATAVIKLDETRQKFVGWTPDAPDDGFPIQGGKGYIVNVLEGKVVAFTGAAWTQPPMPPAAPSILSDAWAFVLSGRLKGKFEDGCIVTVRNIRTGEMATDTARSGYFAVAFADLSRRSVVHVGDRLEVRVRDRFGGVISEPFIFEVRPESIRKAALSVVLDRVGLPDRTELLQNYPNPFNPETWIPYKLSEAGDVMIRIYDLSGRLIRTFDLGHKEPGFYVGRGRAVYWDGRNDGGERVSSGVYVVELQAGDFRAVRRMMLVK